MDGYHQFKYIRHRNIQLIFIFIKQELNRLKYEHFSVIYNILFFEEMKIKIFIFLQEYTGSEQKMETPYMNIRKFGVSIILSTPVFMYFITYIN